MKVDDPVEHVLVVLAGHPLTQRPEVDTEVDITGGLQAGEDSGHDSNATESPLRRPCRVVQAIQVALGEPAVGPLLVEDHVNRLQGRSLWVG